MLFHKNQKVQYDASRCCQCGVCLAACPSSALEKRNDGKQYIIVVSADRCCQCGRCVQVCPAHQISSTLIPPNALAEARNIWLSYAVDAKVRRFASSGGVTRTALYHALQSGLVTAAYTLFYPEVMQDGDGTLKQICKEAEGVWLSDTPDIFSIPRSLYRPILWGENLKVDQPTTGKVLLVGLPCQLKAARSLLRRICPDVDMFTITIFCRKNKNLLYSRYIKQIIRVSDRPNIYHDVVYRGDGWPGSFKVLGDETKTTGYFYPTHCWNFEACYYCLDCLNMHQSDMTVADPWGLISPQNEPEGQNLILVWTEKGQQLIENCGRALTCIPVSSYKANIAVDYRAIKQKEVLFKTSGAIGSLNANLVKEKMKARFGETMFHFVPHTSSIYRAFMRLRHGRAMRKNAQQ